MAEQNIGDSAVKLKVKSKVKPVLVKAGVKPAKAVQKKPLATVKPVKKAAVKKPARKAVAKKKGKPAAKAQAKPALGDLDRKVGAIHAELNIARSAFEKNEAALSKKLDEKIRLENTLNALLRKNFAAEKELLSSVKKGSAKKQEGLKKEIASLEKITLVYEEKKARIDEARKKQASLKKQLMLLEHQAGA